MVPHKMGRSHAGNSNGDIQSRDRFLRFSRTVTAAEPVPQTSDSVVYKVRATVSLKSPEFTVTEGAALQYAGDLALHKVAQDTYVARFLNFSVAKYEHLYGDLENLTAVPLNESVLLLDEVEPVDLSQQLSYPVKFELSSGKVVKYEVSKEVSTWALNVYKSLLTLLQSQVELPQEVPTVVNRFEDGVSGYCRVTYEVHSLTKNLFTEGRVFNVTKTKYLDDCKLTRPVHSVVGNLHKGYHAVCRKHLPDNFLPGFQEETSAFEARPFVGCPEGFSPTDSPVTAHEVSYYNVSESVLEGALSDSLTVLPLLTGEVVVRTRLQLQLATLYGPPTTPVETLGEPHTSLEQHLPEAKEILDLPVYSLLVSGPEEVKAEVFTQVLEQVTDELVSLELEVETKKTPALLLKLVHMVSLFNTEQLKQVMPQALHQKATELEPKDQVLRALYVDLLGKAGSKSAFEVAAYLVKENVLTRFEVTRLFRDLSVYKAYVDKDTLDLLLDLCKATEVALEPLLKVAVCETFGHAVHKACSSKVFVRPVPLKSNWRRIPKIKSRYEEDPELKVRKEDLVYEPVQRLVLPEEKRCTFADLDQYVQALEEALKTTKDFKLLVAYVNALGKMAKPEVLPVLVSYLNGTAENLYDFVDEEEEPTEAVYFVKKAVLLALHHVVEYFPKEVSPLVRAVLLNESEPIDVRTLAFDAWVKSVPTKWELQHVSIAVKLSRSLELKSYVYTAFTHLLKDKHPASSLLVSRLRGIFVHVEALNVGPRYSTFLQKTYYDAHKHLGLEFLLKHIANNVSFFPTFAHAAFKYNLGPLVQTVLETKVLLKGSEKLLDEVFSRNGGLLQKVTQALAGQATPYEKYERNYHETPTYTVVKELGIVTRKVESPKAVLFAKFLDGESVLPLDREVLEDLKKEVLELAVKVGKEGVLNKHYVRLVLPKKVAHVEPTVVGLPVVHTLLHPVLVSLKLKDVSVQATAQPLSVLPETLTVTGTVQPFLLSVKQSRVFVPVEVTEEAPSVLLTNVHHLHLKGLLSLEYDTKVQKKVKVSVKPSFGSVLLSAVCSEHVLDKHSPFVQLEKPLLDVNKCVETIEKPFVYHRTYGAKVFNLEVDAVSHGPYPPLPLYGKLYQYKSELVSNLVKYLTHMGTKQHVLRLKVLPTVEDPVTEYTATFKYSDNLDYLMKTTLDKVYVPYTQHDSSEEEYREQMLFSRKTERRRFRPSWPFKPNPK
ncbi:hypothetical protein HPB48_022818 [Haemaphysalis longicornis]|uniref:Vitellogenin domain-containing protein n=1 Tax=Haemaphysalis longicornis TaxID=44386 RepID=A0A9J6FJN5_HAELO|nr:hypothetical protein HPB48_022818 [Haemaphysalis longicornis]